jgi:hypothetical protein
VYALVQMNARYRRSESVVHRKIGTEAVLVPIRGKVADLDSIYTLNEVGQRIWNLLDGNRTVEQLCEAIAAEYDVTPDQARKDALRFLNELVSIKAAELA